MVNERFIGIICTNSIDLLPPWNTNSRKVLDSAYPGPSWWYLAAHDLSIIDIHSASACARVLGYEAATPMHVTRAPHTPGHWDATASDTWHSGSSPVARRLGGVKRKRAGALGELRMLSFITNGWWMVDESLMVDDKTTSYSYYWTTHEPRSVENDYTYIVLIMVYD